jgi:hypothetical protein
MATRLIGWAGFLHVYASTTSSVVDAWFAQRLGNLCFRFGTRIALWKLRYF